MITTEEMIYRKKRREYLMLDAEQHCNDMAESGDLTEEQVEQLCKKDYDAMAEMFEDAKDCNVADNATWEAVIYRYFREE